MHRLFATFLLFGTVTLATAQGVEPVWRSVVAYNLLAEDTLSVSRLSAKPFPSDAQQETAPRRTTVWETAYQATEQGQTVDAVTHSAQEDRVLLAGPSGKIVRVLHYDAYDRLVSIAEYAETQTRLNLRSRLVRRYDDPVHPDRVTALLLDGGYDVRGQQLPSMHRYYTYENGPSALAWHPTSSTCPLRTMSGTVQASDRGEIQLYDASGRHLWQAHAQPKALLTLPVVREGVYVLTFVGANGTRCSTRQHLR